MKKTNDMVLLSLFCAIVVAMNFIPYTGYISYGGISITTIHIPVIIGAIAMGTRGGLVLGIVWGVSCWVKAITSGSLEAAIFLDPRISVLPRIFVGLLTGYMAVILYKKFKNFKVYSGVIAVIGTLSNTVLVLSAIALWGGDNIMSLGDTIVMIFQVIVAFNGVIELGLAVIIVPIITNALGKAGVLKRFNN